MEIYIVSQRKVNILDPVKNEKKNAFYEKYKNFQINES